MEYGIQQEKHAVLREQKEHDTKRRGKQKVSCFYGKASASWMATYQEIENTTMHHLVNAGLYRQ